MVYYIYLYIISYPLTLYARPELTFFTTHYSKLNSETLHTGPTVASWRSCHCFSLPTVAVGFGQQQQLDWDSNNYNSCRFSLTLDQMPIVVAVELLLLLLFVLQSVALTKKSFLFFRVCSQSMCVVSQYPHPPASPLPTLTPHLIPATFRFKLSLDCALNLTSLCKLRHFFSVANYFKLPLLLLLWNLVFVVVVCCYCCCSHCQ